MCAALKLHGNVFEGKNQSLQYQVLCNDGANTRNKTVKSGNHFNGIFGVGERTLENGTESSLL